ncbi:MAG TPA: hypothetical protein VH702_16015 [Vicinamibacterales bacterium]|jgi:hypothetical protein
MIDLNANSGTTGAGLKSSGARRFLAIVFSVVILGASALWVASMVPQLMTPTISRDQIEAASKVITTAQQDGLLVRYSCTDNRAHVQPVQWRGADDALKEGLTAALAMTCQAERHGYRMTVVDVRTGRDLANFSSGSFRLF